MRIQTVSPGNLVAHILADFGAGQMEGRQHDGCWSQQLMQTFRAVPFEQQSALRQLLVQIHGEQVQQLGQQHDGEVEQQQHARQPAATLLRQLQRTDRHTGTGGETDLQNWRDGRKAGEPGWRTERRTDGQRGGLTDGRRMSKLTVFLVC